MSGHMQCCAGKVGVTFVMAEVLYEVDTDVSLPGSTFADYTYSASQPHAVTGVEREAGTDSFGYDNIGNMTSRTEDGTGWSQIFNAEGRLSSISDGVDTWGFTYDGDGVRLTQSNPDGSTTLFLAGGSYEVHLDGLSTDITHYYAIAGERFMRDSSGDLHYLLTDHLGSVVAVADAVGDVESQQRYAPYGMARLDPGISATDFSYTGQRALEDIGLMDYNARWYSPSLGRFISADTIVPELGNPQALNRYAYVMGNPIVFVDPSGHFAFENPESKVPNRYNTFSSDELLGILFNDFGIIFEGEWEQEYLRSVARGVGMVGAAFELELGIPAFEAFRSVYGISFDRPFTFYWDPACEHCKSSESSEPEGGYCLSSRSIVFATMSTFPDSERRSLRRRNNVIHELGHAFDSRLGWTPRNEVPSNIITRPRDRDNGFPGASNSYDWQQSSVTSAGEIFADQFVLWVANVWSESPLGAQRRLFMSQNMPFWVNEAIQR